MFLWILVFSPAILAVLLALLPITKETSAPWLKFTTLLPLLLFGVTLTYLADIEAGNTVRVEYMWVEALGLELSFVLDGLSLLFVLIITGIGTLITYYSSAYFPKAHELRRFYVYLFIFMTAMLGIVLSGNILGMFVFWELTTISSYLLIGFKHEKAAARQGARQALIVTGGGGLALLGGIALLGVMTNGVYDFQAIDAQSKTLLQHDLFAPMLILILLGAFTKSAQYPFHFWLPGAMEAPTPASSYLHSATMVKAGVYLLARLSHSFGDSDIWLYSLSIIGMFTFVYGAFMALSACDLKAILAYTTVSWLGVLVALIGLNTKESLKAVLIGILVHALYKGALFLIVGSIDHETHTRDIDKLGGIARKMPYTTASASLVLLSMAGIFPMIGFVAKETLKLAALADNIPANLELFFPGMAVAGSAFTVAAAWVIAREVFFSNEPENADLDNVHEAPFPMWIGPLLLGVLSIVCGLFLTPLLSGIVNSGLTTLTGKATEVELHLIPHLDDLAFQLSMLAIGLGLLIGIFNQPLRRMLDRLPLLNPTLVYERIFSTGEFETTQPHLLQTGYWLVEKQLQRGLLRWYLSVMFGGFVLILWATIGYVILTDGALTVPSFNALVEEMTILELIVMVFIAISAIQATRARRRLAAIVWAGVTGSHTALLFVLMGAPDLAFTQLLIEVLSLILMMQAFRLLPRYMQDTSRFMVPRTMRDILIAGSVGITMATIAFLVTSNPIGESIRGFYEAYSYEQGKGHNIVNVILVDFRGIDTLGEITVLVIATLGVLALVSPMPLLDILDRRLYAGEVEFEEDQTKDNESVIAHIYGEVHKVINASMLDQQQNGKTEEGEEA